MENFNVTWRKQGCPYFAHLEVVVDFEYRVGNGEPTEALRQEIGHRLDSCRQDGMLYFGLLPCHVFFIGRPPSAPPPVVSFFGFLAGNGENPSPSSRRPSPAAMLFLLLMQYHENLISTINGSNVLITARSLNPTIILNIYVISSQAFNMMNHTRKLVTSVSRTGIRAASYDSNRSALKVSPQSRSIARAIVLRFGVVHKLFLPSISPSWILILFERTKT